MALDPHALLAHQFPEIEQTISDRDCMLYALSLGVGRDPMDETDLRYVFEKELKIFPTMPVILGHPGDWMVRHPEFGITRKMVVHGAQCMTSHQPLRVNQTVVARNAVKAVLDKGDKGAVLVMLRELVDKASGDLLASMESHVFCRADGGFGKSVGNAHDFPAVHQQAPDAVIEISTPENAALFYRLNQDRNPLHADPAVAAAAGFKRPILHGLCTYGLAAMALMRLHGDAGVARLGSLNARFSKPVFPGETVNFEFWQTSNAISFRAIVKERDAVVLDRGQITLLV
jgi:acyl dehydratase